MKEKNSLEELSIKDAKERLVELKELKTLLNIKEEVKKEDASFPIGKNFYVATVTHHYVGVLKEVTDKEFVLSRAVWTADDGRFHKFMRGEIDSNVEFEPFPADLDVFVGRGALIVACEWNGDIPNEAK